MRRTALPYAEPRREPASPARVVTMTPSPCIDRTYVVGEHRRGQVHRASAVHVALGGNGVNVARVMNAYGDRVRAVTAIGSGDADLAAESFLRVLPVAVPTRVNTIVITTDGTTTNFNQPPVGLSQHDWTRLGRLAIQQIDEIAADWLVVAGSYTGADGPLDPGEILCCARRYGARVCLDSNAEVLREWVRTGDCPDLVKPNLDELSGAVERDLHCVGDAVDACRQLVDAGVRTVLASLGSSGVLLVDQVDQLWAAAPSVVPTDTTGAGDATLGGYLSALARHEDRPQRCLQQAVSWGRRTVEELGTVPGSLDIVPGVQWGAPRRSDPLPARILDPGRAVA